jgi:hypothetical protein
MDSFLKKTMYVINSWLHYLLNHNILNKTNSLQQEIIEQSQ